MNKCYERNALVKVTTLFDLAKKELEALKSTARPCLRTVDALIKMQDIIYEQKNECIRVYYGDNFSHYLDENGEWPLPKKESATSLYLWFKKGL